MKTKTINDVSMIVAVDSTGGFANGRTIPWSFEEDWSHFRQKTEGHVCIMGRGTYEDIAVRRHERTKSFSQLLPKRQSYVVSRSLTEAEGATVVGSVQQALSHLSSDDPREIYILGGRRLYVEFLDHAKQVWMTIVPGTYTTNKKFPVYELSKRYTITEGHETESGIKFVRYVRNVDYYTFHTSNIQYLENLDSLFKQTGRFVSRTHSTVTFVNAKDEELDYLQQVGRITTRKGLAIEDETTKLIRKETV